MNKEEFFKVVKELDENIRNIRVEQKYGYGNVYHMYDPDEDTDNSKLYIYEKWVTGGMTGGDCWDGKADYPVDAEPEPELDALDIILEKLCPNINFLKYKKLVSNLVTRDTIQEQDYYGNYYVYSIKKISLDDLYDYLNDKDMME